MQMGRKSAFVLLANVVLWAAMPALACLTPVLQRTCCQGMARMACVPQAMMHSGDCCQVQTPDAPMPPGVALLADHSTYSAPAAIPAAPAVLTDLASTATLRAAEAHSPPGNAGAGAVLRI